MNAPWAFWRQTESESVTCTLSTSIAWLQVLLLGGDTDTNAAICCGMLGALWGVQQIPDAMRAAVLGCEDWRPAWLMPRQVLLSSTHRA